MLLSLRMRSTSPELENTSPGIIIVGLPHVWCMMYSKIRDIPKENNNMLVGWVS